MKRILLPILLIPLVSTTGCNKKQDSPGGAVRGRVLQINSNTPVPYAEVQAQYYTAGEVWGEGTNEEVYTTLSDEDGAFVIPDSVVADFARAYGNSLLYPFPSEEGSIGRARANDEILNLYLIPRAWIRFIAEDTLPVNPEVQISVAPRFENQIQPAAPQTLFMTFGNLDQEFRYRTGAGGEWHLLPPIRVAGLDTLDYIIRY